ncbi:MAG: class I SAM-dependent methyltransferase [candidate division Zixibacteria bacterium]|nr:class I SAM-dependent methyltransferase [candidate division Zixibacteria bacterium]
MQSRSLETPYDRPEIYDIAFDFRDLVHECDVLDAICQHYGNGKPKSFVDLACGPGYHCVTYGGRGVKSYGIDVNPATLEYARRKAANAGAPVTFLLEDMHDYKLPEPVDLAFCAMSSFHYLLTNDDIIRHLRSVAANLTPGGLYIIEANHPRDVFRVGKSLFTEWEARRGDIVVFSHWGYEDDPYDPIAQITRCRVHIEVRENGHSTKMDFIDLDRSLTHQEFILLIEKSGVFETLDWLGKLDLDQPFDNSKQSVRMIPILKKL